MFWVGLTEVWHFWVHHAEPEKKSVWWWSSRAVRKVLSSATPGMYILHVSHHQGVTNTELTPRPLPSTQSCPAPTHKAGWGRVTQPAPSYSCIRSRGNTNTPTRSRATASSITIAEEHETWNKGWNSKHPVALPGSPREQAHWLTTWK